MNNDEIRERLRKLRNDKDLSVDATYEGIQEKICEFTGENYVEKNYIEANHLLVTL